MKDCLVRAIHRNEWCNQIVQLASIKGEKRSRCFQDNSSLQAINNKNKESTKIVLIKIMISVYSNR